MLASSVPLEKLAQRLAALTARDDTSSGDQVNPYGYTPVFGVCFLFIALFGASAVVHLYQAIRKHTRYMLWSAMGGATLETIGWVGRAWSSKNVYHKTPFLMNVLCTFLAPTFIAAANFVILGGIIEALGPMYSRLAPKRYAQIFVSIDVCALIIQSLGGAMASHAVLNNKSSATGSHIMSLGIFIGLVELAIYITLASGFFWNYSRGKVVRPNALASSIALMEQGQSVPKEIVESRTSADSKSSHDDLTDGRGQMTPRIRAMSYALVASTLCLLIRAIYRAVALTAGFQSSINHSQILFDLLDGMMIIIAVGTLNICHPGYKLAGHEGH